jgi:hypothetical protein
MTTKKAKKKAVPKRPPLADVLSQLRACRGACEWAEPFGTDYRAAWFACTDDYYLTWLIEKLDVNLPGRYRKRRCGDCNCGHCRVAVALDLDPADVDAKGVRRAVPFRTILAALNRRLAAEQSAA